jgi:hypothetical protein
VLVFEGFVAVVVVVVVVLFRLSELRILGFWRFGL